MPDLGTSEHPPLSAGGHPSFGLDLRNAPLAPEAVARTMLRESGMTVRDWMTRHVLTVGPDDSVSKALVLMQEGHVDQLPVLAGRRLVGVVTLDDIGRRLPGSSVPLDQGTVKELLPHVSVGGVMSLHPPVAGPSTGLAEAARQMRETHVAALPIVEDGDLVGLLSLADVVDGLLAMLQASGDGRKRGMVAPRTS